LSSLGSISYPIFGFHRAGQWKNWNRVRDRAHPISAILQWWCLHLELKKCTWSSTSWICSCDCFSLWVKAAW
jgi:hypothetical protein